MLSLLCCGQLPPFIGLVYLPFVADHLSKCRDPTALAILTKGRVLILVLVAFDSKICIGDSQ